MTASPTTALRPLRVGAIVRIGVGDRVQLALARAPGGAWSLPHALLSDTSVSQELAAVAHAQSVTGHKVDVDRFAGTLALKESSVCFWLMNARAPVEPPEPAPGVEVQWLSEADALAHLEHSAEREFLRGALTEFPRLRPPFQRLQLRRLFARLHSYQPELERRIRRTLELPRTTPPVDTGWIPSARSLVAAAHAAAMGRHSTEGWQCLLAAQRMELNGFSDAELTAHRVALGREAKEKLSGWRRDTVESLLALSDVDADAKAPHRAEAAKIHAAAKTEAGKAAAAHAEAAKATAAADVDAATAAAAKAEAAKHVDAAHTEATKANGANAEVARAEAAKAEATTKAEEARSLAALKLDASRHAAARAAGAKEHAAAKSDAAARANAAAKAAAAHADAATAHATPTAAELENRAKLIIAATLVRDEHLQNSYRKLALVEVQLFTLGGLIAVALVALLTLWAHPPDSAGSATVTGGSLDGNRQRRLRPTESQRLARRWMGSG